MTQPCNDPATGALLAAYEMNVLSGDERDRFETHLLTCEHCLARAEHFRPYASLLREDDALRSELAMNPAGENEPVGHPVRRYLWPRMPFVLRPAFLLVIIFLLAYPALRFLIGSGSDSAGPVQVVPLFAARSESAVTVDPAGPRGLVLSFVMPEADPERTYAVELLTADGRRVWYDRNVAAFDERGRMYLLLPQGLQEGEYHLKISRPQDGGFLLLQDLRFRIKLD